MSASPSNFSNSVLAVNVPEAVLSAIIPAASTEAPYVPYASLSAEQREQLLMEYMPSVHYIARRVHDRLPQHVEMDDLVSAGTLGLMDALTKFDAGKGVQFKSYAQFRIRGAILDSLRELDWSPRELRRRGRAVEDAVRALTAKLGRAPLEQEIAAELMVPLEQYHQLVGDLKGLEIGTLNVERNENSGDDEINYIPATEEDDPFLQCMKSEMRHNLAAAIEELPERERMVLNLYYYEELTMREVGEAIGIAESRVSQLHSMALLRLRSAMGPYGSRKLARRARPANSKGDKKTAA